jgi:hypothetical protein
MLLQSSGDVGEKLSNQDVQHASAHSVCNTRRSVLGKRAPLSERNGEYRITTFRLGHVASGTQGQE